MSISRIGKVSRCSTVIRSLFGIPVLALAAVMILSPVSYAEEKTNFERWKEYKMILRRDPGLVAYYTFEEGEGYALKNIAAGPKEDKDYKPEKLNGTILYLPRWTEGRWQGKRALNFTGSYVTCGDDKSFDIGREITLEAWIKFPAYNFENILFRKKTGTKTDFAYGFRIDPGNIFIDTFISGKRRGIRASAKDYPAGHWYHIVGTFNGKTLSFYVNGNLAGSRDYPGTIDSSAGNVFCLGRSTGYGGFNGQIDEVAVYKRILTKEEIKEHYEIGKPLKKKKMVAAQEKVNEASVSEAKKHKRRRYREIKRSVTESISTIRGYLTSRRGLKKREIPHISDQKLLRSFPGASFKMPERIFIPGIKKHLAKLKMGDREERILYMLFMSMYNWSYGEDPENAKRWLQITPKMWEELISPVAPLSLVGVSNKYYPPKPAKCPLCGELFKKAEMDFLNNPFQVKTKCCGGILYGRIEDMPEDYPARPNHIEKILHLDGTIVDYPVCIPKGDEKNRHNWFFPEGELWHSRIQCILKWVMPDLVSGVFWMDNKKAAVELAIILDRLSEVYPGIPLSESQVLDNLALGRDGKSYLTREEYLSVKRPFKSGKPFYYRGRSITKLTGCGGWHDGVVHQLGFLATAFDLIRYREEVKEYSRKKYGDPDAWDKKVMKGLMYEAWLETTGCVGGKGNTMTRWMYGAFKLGIIMKDYELYSSALARIESYIINGYFSDGLCTEGSFRYAGMMRPFMKSLWLLCEYGGVEIKNRYPIFKEIEKGDNRIITLRGVESKHGDKCVNTFTGRGKSGNPLEDNYENAERSLNFPECGLMCLRGGAPGHRLETIGAYQVAIGHTHWDRLNLQVFFEGLNLFPDVGYCLCPPDIKKFPWTDLKYEFDLLPNPNPGDTWGGWKYGHADGSSTHLLVQIDGWADKTGPCTFHRFLGGQPLNHPAYSVQFWEADASQVFGKAPLRISPYKSSYMGRAVKDFPHPVPLYRRQVISVTPLDGRAFLIDIFRIKGGKRHDMYWHVPADSPETSLGTPKPIAEKSLREYFTGRFNPQIMVKDSMADIVSMKKWVNPKGVWKASWLVEPGRYGPVTPKAMEKDYAKWLKVLKDTRISMWGTSFGGSPDKEEIITAKGPWPTGIREYVNGKWYGGTLALEDAFSYLIESRIGKEPGLESVYVHVIEPYAKTEEEAIKNVAIYEKKDKDNPWAVGLKIARDNGSAMYVASTINGEGSFKDREIELKGRLGFISETKEGEAGIIALYDGTYMKSPNVSLRTDKSWNLKLTGIIGDLTGIPQEQALIVESDRPIPLGETLEGQMLTVYHQISDYHTTGYTIGSVEQYGRRLFRINLLYHPTFIQHAMRIRKIDQDNPRFMFAVEHFYKGQSRGAYIGRRIRFLKTGFECAMAGVPYSDMHIWNSDRILLEKAPPPGMVNADDPFIIFSIQPGDRVVIPSLFEARCKGNIMEIASTGEATLKIKTEAKSALKVAGDRRKSLETFSTEGFLEIRLQEKDLKDGLVTIEMRGENDEIR